jgi:hypothetical protein
MIQGDDRCRRMNKMMNDGKRGQGMLGFKGELDGF